MSARTLRVEPILADYFFDLRRGWWMIALSIVAFMAAAGVASAVQDEVYTADADVLVQESPSRENLISEPTRSPSDDLELAKSRAVADIVEDDVGPGPDIRIRQLGDTTVLRITAEAPTAEGAAAAANAHANAFIEVRSRQRLGSLDAARGELQAKLDELTLAGTAGAGGNLAPGQVEDLLALTESVQSALDGQDSAALRSSVAALQRVLGGSTADESGRFIRISALQLLIDEIDAAATLARSSRPVLISPAEPPSDPSRPAPVRNVAVAAIVGLLVAVGVIVARSYVDRRIHRPEELQAASGAPVLGHIGGRVSGHADPDLDMQELRTSMQLSGVGDSLRVIQIVSPRWTEGIAGLARDLAHSFAAIGGPILVMDADFRRSGPGHPPTVRGPMLATGSSDGMTADASSDGVLFVPAGPAPADPAAFFGSTRFASLVEAVRDRFRIVFVVGPSALDAPDAVLIGRDVDATVLVGATGATRTEDVADAVRRLDWGDVTTIGTILLSNGRRVDKPVSAPSVSPPEKPIDLEEPVLPIETRG